LDAAEIARLMEEDRDVFDSDIGADQDDTLMAYNSENESEREVGSDDV
jgi:hypothetical protein